MDLKRAAAESLSASGEPERSAKRGKVIETVILDEDEDGDDDVLVISPKAVHRESVAGSASTPAPAHTSPQFECAVLESRPGLAQTAPHARFHCLKFQHGAQNAQNRLHCEMCFCFVCDAGASECKNWATHCDAVDKGVKAMYWKGVRSQAREAARNQAREAALLLEKRPSQPYAMVYPPGSTGGRSSSSAPAAAGQAASSLSAAAAAVAAAAGQAAAAASSSSSTASVTAAFETARNRLLETRRMLEEQQARLAHQLGATGEIRPAAAAGQAAAAATAAAAAAAGQAAAAASAAATAAAGQAASASSSAGTAATFAALHSRNMERLRLAEEILNRQPRVIGEVPRVNQLSQPHGSVGAMYTERLLALMRERRTSGLPASECLERARQLVRERARDLVRESGPAAATTASAAAAPWRPPPSSSSAPPPAPPASAPPQPFKSKKELKRERRLDKRLARDRALAAVSGSAARAPQAPAPDTAPAKYLGHFDFAAKFGSGRAADARRAAEGLDGSPLGHATAQLMQRARETQPGMQKLCDSLREVVRVAAALTARERGATSTRCVVAVGPDAVNIRAHVFVRSGITSHADAELARLFARIVPCRPDDPPAAGTAGAFTEPPALPPPGRVGSTPPYAALHPCVALRALELGGQHGNEVLFGVDGLMRAAVSDGAGPEAADPAGLAVALRPYQRQTLAFMLARERAAASLAEEWLVRLRLADGQPLLACPVTGDFRLDGTAPQTRGGILAEEMGLGKTVELIALVLSNPLPPPPPPAAPPTPFNRAKTRGTLIVCPVSLLGQWKKELKAKIKHGTPLSVYIYHTGRTSDAAALLPHDVVLTTYSILALPSEGVHSPLHALHWHRVVLDECHYIKNATGHGSQAVLALRADNKWCVSGTPVQTKVDDLRTLLAFLEVGPLAKPATFQELVQRPYDGLGMPKPRHVQFMRATPYPIEKRLEAVGYLRALFGQCVKRHVKTQTVGGQPVLALPPKSERTVLLDFAPGERALYDHIYNIVKPLFERIAVDDERLRRSYMQFVALLLPLRQLCSDSGLLPLEKFLPSAHGGKARLEESETGGAGEPFAAVIAWLAAKLGECPERVEAVGEALRRGEEQCAICLDAVQSPAFTACGHVFCRDCIGAHVAASDEDGAACPTCRAPLQGGDVRPVAPDSLRRDGLDGEAAPCFASQLPAALLAAHAAAVAEGAVSTKAAALMAELEAMRQRDGTAKAVVFTQFNATFERVVAALRRRRFGFVRIDGGMPAAARGRALERFETDPAVTVFVLSVRSGAVGLTLTAADHCFVLEPCMNAGTELQAVNRIHRMGQTRPVSITRFAMRGTVEESILAARALSGPGHAAAAGPSAGADGRAPAGAGGMAGSLRADAPAMRVDEWRRIFA